ncbi:MAG: BatD family protein, partial [Chromatiaceae bacterium]
MILLLLVLGGTRVLAAGLLADPDRTRLGANETLTLRLIAEGQPKEEPDLSPLEADFEILSRSTSSRTTIVNGDMSRSQEWVLELAPKRVGDLTIPSLALGNERSQPVPVQVVPADQVEPGDGPRPLFLAAEVDSQSPYVQEPFAYRVKVYYRKPLLRASLSDPKIEGATIEQRGDDHSYREVLDGEQYTVVERRYLVVPQRSGPLTIQSPRLEAVLIGATRPSSRPRGQRSPLADLEEMLGGGIFNGMPGMSDTTGARRVMERGPDVTLEVRPQPAGTTGPWLPAQSIQLADQWTPSPPRLRVGEPATRTLTITAQGITAAQLPTLDAGSAEGVKVYPEPPSTEDLPGSGPPSAVKTLKLALVPTREGPLTLPEIRLHWWDTVEDRERVSVIPARIFQVEPAAGTVASAEHGSKGAELPRPEEHAPAASAKDSVPSSNDVPGPSRDLPDSRPPVGLWPWLSLLLGLGWLATLGWM